jgi:DNA-binding MarR family transcriptional regulator
MKTSRHLKKWTKTILLKYNLTHSQFTALTHIPPEGIPLAKLAHLFGSDPGNVTGIADRLEREGFIFRKPSLEDRRVIQVFLNDKGREILSELIPMHLEIVQKAMSVLNEDELRALDKILAKLDENIQESTKCKKDKE